MGPVWQNRIQRTVRTAHLSVFMTVHSFSKQYKTEQFWQSPLLPPDKHHSSDVVYQRTRGLNHRSSRMAWLSVWGKVQICIWPSSIVIWTTVKTYRHTTVLQLSGFCPGQPGLAGNRSNIHPLTPIVVISHPLSASSIYYDPQHPPCSNYVPDSLFPQKFSKFSLVDLLAWHPQLHTPYISSPNHVFFSQYMPIPLQPVLL